MRNLHNFIDEKHRNKSLCLLWKWKNLQIKDSYYRNHCRSTFRCLSKDLIPVSVRLKSTINTRRAKQIIPKEERQLLQDRIKRINSIMWDNTVRLDRCRSRLSSLVTSTTVVKCTNFINKVRESRFTKARDKQVNKCNRLMGKDKDRDQTTQHLANTTQLPSQSNSNKWVINLSSNPLSKAPRAPLIQGLNYAVAPKNAPI